LFKPHIGRKPYNVCYLSHLEAILRIEFFLGVES
jgi:hypothetical protein